MERALGFLLAGLGGLILLVTIALSIAFINVADGAHTTVVTLSLAIGLFLVVGGMVIANTWGDPPSSI